MWQPDVVAHSAEVNLLHSTGVPAQAELYEHSRKLEHDLASLASQGDVPEQWLRMLFQMQPGVAKQYVCDVLPSMLNCEQSIGPPAQPWSPHPKAAHFGCAVHFSGVPAQC